MLGDFMNGGRGKSKLHKAVVRRVTGDGVSVTSHTRVFAGSEDEGSRIARKGVETER